MENYKVKEVNSTLTGPSLREILKMALNKAKVATHSLMVRITKAIGNLIRCKESENLYGAMVVSTKETGSTVRYMDRAVCITLMVQFLQVSSLMAIAKDKER